MSKNIRGEVMTREEALKLTITDLIYLDELESTINQAIERGNVNQETLEVMKELLRNAKSISITEFYKDQQ